MLYVKTTGVPPTFFSSSMTLAASFVFELPRTRPAMAGQCFLALVRQPVTAILTPGWILCTCWLDAYQAHPCAARQWSGLISWRSANRRQPDRIRARYKIIARRRAPLRGSNGGSIRLRFSRHVYGFVCFSIHRHQEFAYRNSTMVLRGIQFEGAAENLFPVLPSPQSASDCAQETVTLHASSVSNRETFRAGPLALGGERPSLATMRGKRA